MNKRVFFIFTLIAVLADPSKIASSASRPQKAIKVLPAKTIAPVPILNISDLQAALQKVFDADPDKNAIWAAQVFGSKGQPIFQYNNSLELAPASNLKLFVTSAALSRLGPDFSTKTSVYADSAPDSRGVINGNIILYGRGDPNLSARFYNGDYLAAFRDLANQLAQKGVKVVSGNIIGDQSYFDGAITGNGWTDDDLQWYYGAEISALSVDENAVDLAVYPGKRIGAPVSFSIGPKNSLLEVQNTAVTTRYYDPSRPIQIKRVPNDNIIQISGSVPLRSRGLHYMIAIHDPALFAAALFKDVLASKGIVVEGGAQSINADQRGLAGLNTSALDELASLNSIPLSSEIQIINTESNNLHAEILLRQLGLNYRSVSGTYLQQSLPTSEIAGLYAEQDFLRQAGLFNSNMVMLDGSGLSRADRVTVSDITSLLRFNLQQSYFDTFKNSLAQPGQTGTLHFHLQELYGKLFAKTGSFDNTFALSGYLYRAGLSQPVVFSFITDNNSDSELTMMDRIDQLVRLLANYQGSDL